MVRRTKPLLRACSALFLFVIATLSWPRISKANCPNNEIGVPGSLRLYSAQAKEERTGSDAEGRSGRAGYDLVKGSSFARASSGFYCGCLSDADVRTTDIYQLVGSPTEGPVIFEAKYHLTGDVGGEEVGTLSLPTATVRQGTSEHVYAPPYGYVGPIDHTLTLSIERKVGEMFELHVGLLTSAMGTSAAIEAQLEFANLPAGVAVVSCQGYQQGVPVPVTASTWGAIKAHHR